MSFNRKAYNRAYYQKRRNELIQKLGGKCIECGRTYALEIHHVTGYNKRSRPNSREYFNPEGKELRCWYCHKHTESWRRKRKRQKG